MNTFIGFGTKSYLILWYQEICILAGNLA